MAVEHPIELAEQFGAIVHALFAVEQTGPSGHWDFEIEEAEVAGEAALDAVVTAGDERGVENGRHLRRGIPSEEIVDAAAGYGLSRIATAGSTTERVVRLTATPTLVIGGAGA